MGLYRGKWQTKCMGNSVFLPVYYWHNLEGISSRLAAFNGGCDGSEDNQEYSGTCGNEKDSCGDKSEKYETN